VIALLMLRVLGCDSTIDVSIMMMKRTIAIRIKYT